jgi:phosphinothricin acetyltransferase
MQLRLAAGADLTAINAIYNQAVEDRFSTAHLVPVTQKEREQWYQDHDSARYPVYVAEEAGEVRGWASLGPYRPGRQALAHVAEVSYYVAREHRGRGTGTILLGHAIRVAPELGYAVLIAILLSGNRSSIRLLEKYGFEKWGSMPGIARIEEVKADHLYYGLKLSIPV